MTTPQERAAAYWQHSESAKAQDHAKAMQAFTVRIGKRGAPRMEFAAMSVSSVACFNQHFDMAEVGERVEILPVAEIRAERRGQP